MAGHQKIPGPIARNVAANVRRERKRLNLTAAELSERMTQIGAPLLDTGIHKLEGGYRQVTVDDLVALSAALDTPPNVLLLPAADNATNYGKPVALTPGYDVTARRAWQWAVGEHPLADSTVQDEARFVMRARPHRFTLTVVSPEEWIRDTHAKIFGVVVQAMAAGVTVDQLRTMTELAISTGLISGMVPARVDPAGTVTYPEGTVASPRPDGST